MVDEKLFKISHGKRHIDQRHSALSETTCYIKDGLRHVNPYYHLFYTYAKSRWIGLKLIQLFEKEFLQRTTSKILEDIHKGKIRVNGEKKSFDYIIKNNDIIQSLVHRHELPVPFDGIDLIYEDKNIIVIDKPSGMPIHPMGRYRHNTLLFYLYKEKNQQHLYTVHRLDRLTSGVTIMAKDSITAKKYSQEIIEHNLEKEYYCMVEGEFPEYEIICEQPIRIASVKLGICLIDSCNGKYSKTIFNRIKFKNGKSIVKCIPITGRMHQIRVHMQWLGFPIIGDPIYGHPTAFGISKGYHGNYPSIDEIIERLLEGRQFTPPSKELEIGRKRKHELSSRLNDIHYKECDNTYIREFYDNDCLECTQGFYATNIRKIMCLHSAKYKIFNMEFVSKLPNWYYSLDIPFHNSINHVSDT